MKIDLQRTLNLANVHWDQRVEPSLRVAAGGKKELTICKSFSRDAGYSLYHVGEGATIEECIANLHSVDI